MGAIACGSKVNTSDLVDRAKAAGSMEGKDYVQHVTCQESYSWNELPWSLESGFRNIKQEKLITRPHLVAVDCGIKYNILRLMLETGFRITVVPANASAQQILALNPDALFISNGPGDPEPVTYTVSTVRELLGRMPMFWHLPGASNTWLGPRRKNKKNSNLDIEVAIIRDGHNYG